MMSCLDLPFFLPKRERYLIAFDRQNGSASPTDGNVYNVGEGMQTGTAEALGTDGNGFNEMAFSIEKVTVTAKSRALKAEY